MVELFKGIISLLLYGVNTLFWFIPIIIQALLKLIPIPPLQSFFSRGANLCAQNWVKTNTLIQGLNPNTQWDIDTDVEVDPNTWNLIISNHQSWVDIMVLQRIFDARLPFLKFFLKKELIWVPILGLAWWALGFPFMRRYTRAFLDKNPHLKGKDLETTRKACQKFEHIPVSIINFVEGTRWTATKHQKQQSPFLHLLKPKAGGIAFVLSAMGQKLDKLIDVTIYYPGKTPTFWNFVSGKVDKIKVKVETISLDSLKQLDYFNNPDQQAEFQQWLNQKWQQKDQQLAQWH